MATSFPKKIKSPEMKQHHIIPQEQIFPSGKLLHNYGKSPFLMGKSTINVPFSIAMLVYRGYMILLDPIRSLSPDFSPRFTVFRETEVPGEESRRCLCGRGIFSGATGRVMEDANMCNTWMSPQTVDGHAMLFLHMFASEFYRHIYTCTQTHIWETTTTIATLLE